MNMERDSATSHILTSLIHTEYVSRWGGGGVSKFFFPGLFISKLRLPKAWSRNSSVGIVTSYGLDNRRIVVRFSRVVKRFVFPLK